ncbi:hypothetical protein GALMADRAFT_141483 [Galerina marginata CBS 339.88]|uniref:Uncharacterized protein n=1 Tax=Galerina marginata (strain CBS 339.88) TaxID=685588 RepID=A0A067SUB8_GALM3|nr:hypothetical protein GALMADRAFT_141483 [Galerina marginata CBS 339.88]
MSFSVDDLVSSFSSSHIGQEAIDLATLQVRSILLLMNDNADSNPLQAQLAETLFSGSNYSAPHGRQTSLSTRGRTQNTQPCTTPTHRTPSLSSSFNHGWNMDTGRGRGNSVSSTYLDDMEEDERMVEELLIPSSPTLPSVSGSHFGNSFPTSTSASSNSFSQNNTNNNGFSSYNHVYSEPSPSSPTANGSLFTTTDPFYIAQLQASNNTAPQSPSVFAQNGRLAQSSPFALPQYHTSFHAHGQNWEHHHTSAPFKTAAAF